MYISEAGGDGVVLISFVKTVSLQGYLGRRESRDVLPYLDVWVSRRKRLSDKKNVKECKCNFVCAFFCRGKLLTVPCSHVGHIFRDRSPYKWAPGVDIIRKNTVRVAEVWLDDFKNVYYQRLNNKLVSGCNKNNNNNTNLNARSSQRALLFFFSFSRATMAMFLNERHCATAFSASRSSGIFRTSIQTRGSLRTVRWPVR